MGSIQSAGFHLKLYTHLIVLFSVLPEKRDEEGRNTKKGLFSGSPLGVECWGEVPGTIINF